MTARPRAHQVHSAFAWDAGDRAFVIMVDNEEISESSAPGTPVQGDVDIVEITDPRNPRLVKETGLNDWPGRAGRPVGRDRELLRPHAPRLDRAQDREPVRRPHRLLGRGLRDARSHHPEAPVFMDDSTYPSPDPFSGLQFPEGNGHQAEFSKCPDEPS